MTERSNYPGFELQQRLFTHYAGGLRQVSERMNEAWGKLAQGQYGVGEWVTDLSRSATDQYEFVQELMRLTQRDDHRPVWARLRWSGSTIGTPSETVDLIRPIPGVLEAGVLKPMAGGAGQPDLKLTLDPVLDGNRLRVAIADGSKKPAVSCTYIGFVSTQEARHTPEVIVLLEVS
ncbi:MAG: hypothetical protein RL033_1510 [Pseudomonadota bacterium]|jgi:hypothetical protein